MVHSLAVLDAAMFEELLGAIIMQLAGHSNAVVKI
jgi:hypothetical protein